MASVTCTYLFILLPVLYLVTYDAGARQVFLYGQRPKDYSIIKQKAAISNSHEGTSSNSNPDLPLGALKAEEGRENERLFSRLLVSLTEYLEVDQILLLTTKERMKGKWES